MTSTNTQGILAFYKSMIEADSIYQKFQKHSGLAHAEFWSLVAIRLEHCKYQHEICNLMMMSKQTVNTALKQLVKKGYITLDISLENQRMKSISLTKEGETFSKTYIDLVRLTEDAAWQKLSDEEQNSLLTIYSKLNGFLDAETNRILTSTTYSSKDV